MKKWEKFFVVAVLVLIGIVWIPMSAATEDFYKSFGGVVWGLDGAITYKDEGIVFVNTAAFSCLSAGNYFVHNRCISLATTAEKKWWMFFNIEAYWKETLRKRSFLANMSSEERFLEALSQNGFRKEDRRNFIVITEKVVYPKNPNEFQTYWFTFIPQGCWACKNDSRGF